MEEHFPRKALATHRASSPQVVLLSVLGFPISVKAPEIWSSEHRAVCLWLLSVLILIRARSVSWLQPLCSDFRSVVLLPDALNRFILPVTSLFWRMLVFPTMGKPALPPNWINLKIISAATIRIIGLTNIAKIEFLPLDWNNDGTTFFMIQVHVTFKENVTIWSIANCVF